jgi:histidyl-tRNA synthetase
MATSSFARLPGFRDFPPEELALRSHIQDAWRRVSRRYGFLEYDGPPLEPLQLYVEKSGAEIVGQLYNFTDKGGREVALRPEMTPSLARILGDRSRGMSKPIRWFSTPQLFRYERQQRGRLREHYQWNADIVGEDDLTERDFRARVSDRRLLREVLLAEGVPEDRLPAAFGIIDKLERMPPEKSRSLLLTEAELGSDEADALIELLQAGGGLASVRERFAGNEAVGTELARLSEYVAILTAMGLGSYVEVDLRIVRGLAYYTGIVFELFDVQGSLRAICGGGRYDRLLELVGGEPLPAVGFGMGDVVLGELLAERGLLPVYTRALDYFVVPVSAEQRTEALRIAHALRDKGHSVAYALEELGVAKQLKAADREGAREVLIVGPDELARGCVVAKDMGSGSEREISLAELT